MCNYLKEWITCYNQIPPLKQPEQFFRDWNATELEKYFIYHLPLPQFVDSSPNIQSMKNYNNKGIIQLSHCIMAAYNCGFYQYYNQIQNNINYQRRNPNIELHIAGLNYYAYLTDILHFLQTISAGFIKGIPERQQGEFCYKEEMRIKPNRVRI